MIGSEVCFKEAAEAWIKSATTRSRKRMRLTSVPTLESALRLYIYPVLGSLPLSEVHNGSLKLCVDKMKAAGLSSATQNGYCNIVKSVMKSIINPVTGEPVHARHWNSTFLDLAVVEHSKTPCPSAALIEKMLSQTCRGSWERRLFLLLPSTGLRIDEALALEWSDLRNDGRTLSVTKQVNRFGVVVQTLKTKSGKREIDLHPDVTKVLLADCPGSKSGLMFSTSNGSPFLAGNIEKRRLRDFVTGSFHQFRRFRNSHLREVNAQPDLLLYWMGHKPSSMTEVYSKISRNLEFRLAEAERVGLGFVVKEGFSLVDRRTGKEVRPTWRVMSGRVERLKKQKAVA